MTEQQISYDRQQLRRSGDGVVAAHDAMRAHLRDCQSRIDGFGQWWNPDNDQNDLIGGLLGACVTAAHQLMMDTGHQNLDVLHEHGRAMQAMAGNMDQTQAANTDVTKSV